MARIDNLTNFLTDVADSIRAKTGSTESIPAQNFDTEIDSLPVADITEYFESDISSTSYAGVALIKKIPDNTTVSTNNLSNAFYNMKNLTEIPLLDTSNVLDMRGMFANCSSLISIPQLDTSNVTTIQTCFSGCSSLTTLPLLNFSKVINIQNIIISCPAVTTLGGFLNLGQAYLTTASASYASYRLTLSGANNLTHDSLMNVINNLYDIASAGVQTQQLVLGSTNLAKLTDEEILIATNKGWTVS